MLKFNDDKKYNVIYADCGILKQEVQRVMVENPNQHYDCRFYLEDIKNLPVKDIADKDCILFVWVIDGPMLPQAFEVMVVLGDLYIKQ